MQSSLRFWLLMTGMVLPGIALIGQQWLLGQRLSSMEVYERDGRVRRAVDSFINDCLTAYREQNDQIFRRLLEPLNTSRKLDVAIPESFAGLADVRRELNRPAALFVALPRGNTFDIRYFALDESDAVKMFYEPTLEPIHQAVLGYIHSMIPGAAFRERLRANRFHESSEHWPYGVVHFFHAPVYTDDPVYPRAYVGMWETVDFATQSFLLPYVNNIGLSNRLRDEGLDPSIFRWSIESGDGETIFASSKEPASNAVLNVRFAAFGPLFEQFDIHVATLAGRAHQAGPVVRKQSVWVLSLAALWFVVAGLLLTRSAMRDRWLARMHRDFVGRISHELKTPVAVSLNAVESLRNPKLATAANSSTFLDILHSQLRGLTGLLDRLIDVSRLSAGSIPIAPRRMELDQHLQVVIPKLARSVGLPEDSISLSCEEQIEAVIDSTALDLILRNLLENAVKYASAGQSSQPPLELSCSNHSQWVTLSLRDHGPGLDRRERRRIFRPFYRVTDGLRADTPGHGLGLSLVRSLMLAHGGDVTVETAPGGGCVFRLRFPKANPS